MEVIKRLKEIPLWLKWMIRGVIAYLSLLALILASTIIVILITFSLIVVDFIRGNDSMRNFTEQYLVPISEFMWKMFTFLIPGL